MCDVVIAVQLTLSGQLLFNFHAQNINILLIFFSPIKLKFIASNSFSTRKFGYLWEEIETFQMKIVAGERKINFLMRFL